MKYSNFMAIYRIYAGNAISEDLIFKIFSQKNKNSMGHSRKHPYHPHEENWKLTPLHPSDVLAHLLLSETILSPLPLRTAEISSVGGVWIFSGTTQLTELDQFP
jgi:hypothetical protein